MTSLARGVVASGSVLLIALLVFVPACGGSDATIATPDSGNNNNGNGSGSGNGNGNGKGAGDPITTASDGGGGGGADAKSDADPPASGPFKCGGATCTATQYCIQPCCGGPAPQCVKKEPDGLCPVGFHASMCWGRTNDGCVEDDCKPPPPYCVDDAKQAPVGCMKENPTSHAFMCLCA